MSLIVVANITPKSGMEPQMENVLRALIEPTLKEPGCVRYELHRDLESGHLTFLEEWTDQAALDDHFQTEHFKAAGPGFEEFGESLEVKRYERIG